MLSDPLLCSSQRSGGGAGGGVSVGVVDDDQQNSVDLINDSISSLVDESVHSEPMYVSADALDIDHL